MVMMRHAMSMIELVVAIVIMGITVMTLPLILTQVQNNNAFAMQQEAILAAKAKIGDILTYEWDNKSYDDNASRSFVLDTPTGDSELARFNGQLRRGHVNAESRRKFYATETNATTTLGMEGVTFNDIDDFTGRPPNRITATLESAGTLDYVFDLNLATTVNYVADDANYTASTINGFAFNFANAPAIPTNIKTISVTVSGGDQNITLRAFTCNIGEATPLPSRPYR